MSQLGWKHHTLIQALLSRGPLKEMEFCTIFAEITGKNPATNKQLFNDCLLKINKELDVVQFELRAFMDQYDGNIYYGIVNNVADDQSKLGTKYSPAQIAFYKAIIEAIVLDGTKNGCITNIEALNVHLEDQAAGKALQDNQSCIPAAFKSFSISQKEKALNQLIKDRWLSSTSDGQVGLGIRSFLDLRSWFQNNEVVSCEVCNEAAIKAENCPNKGCSIRMHSYCLKKKFYQRKVARICPGCGTSWDPSDCFIEEEEAAEEPSQSNETTEASAKVKKRTRSYKIERDANELNQAPLLPPLGKRLRSCKAETRNKEPSSSSPVRPLGIQRARRSTRG
ncbi:hypothetical protein HPP92_018370 [Vanilla planifolia]|uniref:Non-structural maintenance of chromosomes element 1 homolog n=1 Tax=Vanilla planifolia TaxID=51239 RepID=A0A835UPB3_VANPL|nr:hypothetical protein HPP92_018370 [Vanilla planifolia]